MGERKLLGPKIVQATMDKVNIIRAKLKVTQDRQKSYTDMHRKDLESEVGDRVFLNLSPWKGVYISNPSHVLEKSKIELRDDLFYEEQPVQILRREEKRLRNKTIALVKVLWRNHLVEEATWEQEDQMRSQYPYLFQN
nr:uncharacterized protein LOC125419255 [Ziziphus jujuba var. spinosa]